MRGRLLALLAAVGLLVGSAPAMAQAPTGDIVGRAADTSGAVLPGVVVTVSGGSLIQPLSSTTGDTGTYLFPGLQPGTYSVKFELTGFRTVVVEGVRVNALDEPVTDLGVAVEHGGVAGQGPLLAFGSHLDAKEGAALFKLRHAASASLSLGSSSLAGFVCARGCDPRGTVAPWT